MCRSLFCSIAVAINFATFVAANAEDEGKWELEERRSFVYTLSYKQSAYINNQLVTSELALLCDQRNRIDFVGAILMPFDGTFESHQDPIPVSIQKKSDEFERSDLYKSGRMGASFSSRT
jgi:hypothetical protein